MKPTDYQRHPHKGSKIPDVTSAQTCREGDRYRWVIRTRSATYVDGGNYASRDAAVNGLRDALRVPNSMTPAEIRDRSVGRDEGARRQTLTARAS